MKLFKSSIAYISFLLVLLISAGWNETKAQDPSSAGHEAIMASKIASKIADTEKSHVVEYLPVSHSIRAAGDDCTDPIIINIPGNLPYAETNQTTCGRGNVYDLTSSCLGNYDNGEDIIYQLNVTGEVLVNIKMTPDDEWTGMALWDDCPDAGNCLSHITYSMVGYVVTPMVITYTLLPGTYYLMMDSYPNPVCYDFDLEIREVEKVASFPFTADFEDGEIPDEFAVSSGSEANVSLDASAASNSSLGLLFEGGTATGWGTTPGSWQQAFDPSKNEHFGNVEIIVEPDSTNGTLKMRFDLRQGYSYYTNYCWFRVMADDVMLPDDNGYIFFQPFTHNDPFVTRTFNLENYQDTTFTVKLQSSCKYYKNYYEQGDVVHVDNFQIWYQLPPGTIEGYVFNGDGLTIANAHVGIEGLSNTTSNAFGYYSLDDIPPGEYEVIAWKEGYNPSTEMVTVQPAIISQQDFILTMPTMFVSPTFHDYALNPNEYLTTNTGILNIGDGPLHWEAEIVYQQTEMVLSGEEPRNIYPDENAEYSPTIRSVNTVNPLRNTWDIQFMYPVAVGNGEAGAESDGQYLYSSKWNGSQFYKYELDGTFSGNFTISGTGNIRDLAYVDPEEMMYGGAATSTCYRMDFSNQTLEGSYTAPTQVRAIAYDPGNDGLYANNWSSDITLFDRSTGAYINSFPVGTYGNYYGFAYDEWTDGGPYLWGFSQDGSGAELVQISLPGGTETGLTMDVLELLGGTQIAGGLYTHPEIAEPGLVTIGGVLQNELLFGLELAEGTVGPGNWLTLDWYEGTVPPDGGLENIPTNFNASGTSSGEVYEADIVFTSDPNVGTVIVPCTMTVLGDPINPPENLEISLVNDITGEVSLTWTWNTRSFQYFIVKRDGILIGTTTNTYYTDFLPDYGEYCYTVQAKYDEGNTSPAGPECLLWANPDISIDPAQLEAWVWTNNQKTVVTSISNNGTGTLHYIFPAFAGTNDPESYCNASGGCDEYISEVSIGPTSNSSGCTNYGDYTDIITTVQTGNSYPVGISIGNPYSNDIVGIWVDWNHDEIFNEPMIQPNGDPFNGFTANLEPPGNAVSGNTRMRIRLQWGGTLNPCGTTTFGEVEDYTLFVLGGFITDVSPAEGYVSAGSTREVSVTYDATGFPEGDYTQQLLCESNDPENPQLQINNAMHVYVPAHFMGTVTNGNTGAPVAGVRVTAGSYQAITLSNGTYSLYVDEGTYDVQFEKLGYQDIIVSDTFAQKGMITTLDVEVFEEPYPPSLVTATVNDDDTECLVEWALPIGPYEILYDDGTAEELVIWSQAGNENAVKFSPFAPPGYPVNVVGGRIFVGDGSFPTSNWLGSEIVIIVYDDDGQDGLPGSILDSTTVAVNNYGWAEFWELDALVEEGNFYISVYQLNPSTFSPPLGVDYTFPIAYRSYSRLSGTEWFVSPYQDFMIRAYVEGPAGTFISLDNGEKRIVPPKIPENTEGRIYFSKNGLKPWGLPGFEKGGKARVIDNIKNTNREVLSYELARVSGFDPNTGPQSGALTMVATDLTELSFNDSSFGILPLGWYAYAVRSEYTNGDVSEWTYSNIIGHLKEVAVNFDVILTTGGIPVDVEITMTGEDWPYDVYYNITDTTGNLTFDPVWKGNYSISVSKVGFETYLFNDNIQEDIAYEIVLGEKRYAPRNLWVDPLTSWANWEWPLVTAAYEDFDSDEFPPYGWQSLTLGTGWFLTNNGSSPNFQIPPWDSQYACVNNELPYGGPTSSNNGCCDYLITPPLDLRETDEFKLFFDSFYNGYFGQLAFVEYSFDAGETWDILYAMPPVTGKWSKIVLDLSALSGINSQYPVWIAFHTDDAGNYGTGWAIDNVGITNGAASPQDFWVFLDGSLVAPTDSTFFQYPFLTYGLDYQASVAARYTSGLSEKIYYEWTSEYLTPPRNLNGETFDNAVHIWWEPPVEPANTYELISAEPRIRKPNPYNEYSPDIRVVRVSTNTSNNRDQWDVQFNFPTGYSGGEAGAETDGSYIYTSQWNAGNGTFYKYELDGNYLGPFTIAGCQDVRDLAYNPDQGLMFGSNAGNVVWAMNFIDQIVEYTVLAPVLTRAIAYDEDQDGFWANNWDTDITLFDKNGAIITSFPVGNFGSLYGFAYDKWSEGGPYLWGFSQAGAGAELVQYDIATGQEIFNMDLLPLLNGTQVAGGLFTHPHLIQPGIVTLGGILQNELIFGLELTETSIQPPPYMIPPNLKGYKVYRDNENIDYLSFTGDDTTHYYDFNLDPLTFNYDVSAVYDLTPYGFPGDSAESAVEGPFIVTVKYGHPLPFQETWNSGSFDLNQWIHGQNWQINGQIGHPKPSAEFSWDPVIQNYKSSLTSYPLDGINLNDPFIDGCIWFDFDIRLDDQSLSGKEKLSVEVGNESGWTKLVQFNNAKGSFDWKSYHYNISSWAFGQIFRIRFIAEGEQSINILSWFVDNIVVYRTCPGPKNLEIEQLSCVDLKLTWKPPETCVSIPDERELLGYNIFLNNVFLDYIADTLYYYTVAENGTYTFEVMAIFEDCASDTSAIDSIDIACVGINHEYYESSIAIFPNPARDYIYIISKGNIEYIRFLNGLGQVLFDQIEFGGNRTIIDVSNYEPGIYYIIIRNKTGIIKKDKVIVSH